YTTCSPNRPPLDRVAIIEVEQGSLFRAFSPSRQQGTSRPPGSNGRSACAHPPSRWIARLFFRPCFSQAGRYTRHRRLYPRETLAMSAVLSCHPLRIPPLLLLLLVAPPARADEGASSAIRARMQAFVDQGDLAGAVTVVGRRDAVVSHEA